MNPERKKSKIIPKPHAKKKRNVTSNLIRKRREVTRSSKTLNLVRKKVRVSLQKKSLHTDKNVSFVFTSYLFLRNEQRGVVVGAHFFHPMPNGYASAAHLNTPSPMHFQTPTPHPFQTPCHTSGHTSAAHHAAHLLEAMLLTLHLAIKAHEKHKEGGLL